MSTAQPPVCVFLHAGDYDRMHQGLSIAAAAVAGGRRVDVFFFWWALERLAQGELDVPDFGKGHEAMQEGFESGRFPTLRRLLEYLRESGQGRLFACTGSMGMLGLEGSGIERLVDAFVGWSRILELTVGVTDRFYL